MSKSTAYTIELKSGGNVITTVRTDVGCEDVLVGRSDKCTMRTPADDRLVSGCHLRLYWRRKSLYAEDAGSRNGVYYNGVRMTKARKVSSGDVFAVGNYSVSCEKEQRAEKKASVRYHKLERLNGEDAGTQIDICPKAGEAVFTIGKGEDNALVLRDALVSRRHAEIVEQDTGECYIRDLGSGNGTMVNGEPLPQGKIRYLQDNDIIRIAYFDFKFWDKKKKHRPFLLWVTVFAVAATICAMVCIFILIDILGPSAEYHLHVARSHAANVDFSGAKDSLKAAKKARDADKYTADIDTLETLVDRWENTWNSWTNAQQRLSDGRLKGAWKIIAPLTSGVRDAWGWNGTSAIEEKKNAEFAAEALRRYSGACDVLDETSEGQPEKKADEINTNAVLLARYIEETKPQFAAQPYLEKLAGELQDVFIKMTAIQSGFARVDACIAKLDAMNPDFARLVVQLDGVVCDKSLHGAVRSYADKYKQPCAELADAKLFIRKEWEDLNVMRFTAVKERADKLKLPAKDLCDRHPRLSDHRQKLAGHHADTQKYAENLETMVNGLSSLGVMNGDCSEPLKRALSTDSWNKAFTFACFEERPPTMRRKVPCGSYDELLGVDFTFQSLRTLPGDYNGVCLRLVEFVPDVVEARKALEYIDVFIQYIEERPPALRRGELGAFCKYCKNLQAQRDQLLKFLAEYKGEARAMLIAGFYHGWFLKHFSQSRRNELKERFNEIQREVSVLCEKCEELSDPVAQIAFWPKILGVAIPGDSQIHAIWVGYADWLQKNQKEEKR